MTKCLFLLGAGALVAAAPAAAKPEGHGHGNGHHASEAQHGKHHSKANYYAYGRTCPPGLAKKNNGCMPPGQLKRMYNRGQRYNLGYGNRWSYNQIPYDLRQQYGFNSNYRYYYGDGYLYQVDPKTMLIQQVVNAIVH
jgi:opacity protein-like surface antigen